MPVDPTKITNYNLSAPELEEHLLFWVCAAGKNGVTAAKCLDRLLSNIRAKVGQNDSPLKTLRKYEIRDDADLELELKSAGIGCYRAKANTFRYLIVSPINLKTCTVDNLERIPGIGPKTARCFLIHSRPNQKLAGLDVHILRFLADKGYDVTKNTPSGKRYKKIEQFFIKEAELSGKNIADFDLEIWKEYRTK